MNIKESLTSWYRRVTFQGLSIQERLPLLICLLLCTIIVIFSFASYYGVKRAAIDTGKSRLRTLTDQLANLLGQSSQTLNTSILATLQKDIVKKNIRTGGVESKEEVLTMLNKLKKDSTWVLLELLDSVRRPVLSSGNKAVEQQLSLNTIFSHVKMRPNTCKVGKVYAKGDSMHYPIVASVTDQDKIMGYLVIWRSLTTTPQALEQFSKLLGTGATLYIGNADGSLWTNLMKPVPKLPVDVKNIGNYLEYTNDEGTEVIGAVQKIANSEWLVLVAFAQQTVLESARSFLNWIFLLGGFLIAVGIVLTWVMSRNIIKPLNELTAAATAIAAGEYSHSVKINRMDELGKLVQAFNTMSDKIQTSQLDLEKKIGERTLQLETANKELESFSYSVSHDLRAPLRSIIGFTSILQDKYVGELDDEAKRLFAIVKKNTIRMGDLIDDLLAFSKLGRNDIVKTNVNTDNLVKEVIGGMEPGEQITWHIHPLPDCKADLNTIRQVWINLVSNAIKYSRHKEQPQIEIGTVPHGDEKAFYIKDNGVGFDQKYAGKLFQVFQRLHAANEFEGTGIGLAIVEKIISKHGGKVWVEAEKDKGATFYFVLPD